MNFTRHPRNTDFQWADHEGPFAYLSAGQVKAYDEQGFVVLEDVFDPETIDAAIAAIDPLDDAVESFLEANGGKAFIARAGEITFTPHVCAASAVLRAICASPVMQGIGQDLLGPDVRLYWDQAVYKKPGTKAPFPWHQDNGYTYVEPQQYVTCWIALTDATVDNGCPWVIPGVHRGGTLLHQPSELGFVCVEDVEDEAVPAPVAAGGIVLFSSLTPHATGPNTSDGIRKSYIVQLAPDGANMFPRNPDGSEAPDCQAVPAANPSWQFPILIGGRPA